MKVLIAAIFAAGVSLTTLSSAQAITVTAAPLGEAATATSSVIDVQACGRGLQATPRGCQPISFGYKAKKKKKKKKQW
jgi:hypothetical protein